jgi:hypothetical protein
MTDISDSYGQVSGDVPEPADGMSATGDSTGNNTEFCISFTGETSAFKRLVGLYIRTAMTSETRGDNRFFREWLRGHLDVISIKRTRGIRDLSHEVMGRTETIYVYHVTARSESQWTQITLEYGDFGTLSEEGLRQLLPVIDDLGERYGR